MMIYATNVHYWIICAMHSFSPGYKFLTWLHKRAFKEIIQYFQDNKMMISESINE